MELAGSQEEHAGSPVTVKVRVTDSPWAFVTVAVMEAGEVGGTQAGAVQLTRPVSEVLWGVPRVPALVLQEKVSELFCGSLAVTSNASCWAGCAVSADWKARRMLGGKRVAVLVETHSATEPVVCPPRPSETVTVS